MRRVILTLFLACLITPPSVTYAGDTPHWVHYSLLSKRPVLPKKVVVFPVNVEVYEVTAGGVKEEVPQWSEEAAKNIFTSINSYIKGRKSLTLKPVPKLSSRQADAIDEHLALYKLVVNTAADIGWEHKIKHFDYSIGSGLSFLRRLTGADAAVLVYGRDYASTGGRKAAAFFGAIIGAGVELGHSFIHLGIVDLRTGNLLWMNSEFKKGSTNLRDYNDANKMIKTVFKWYPGIESYRKTYLR